VELRKVLRLRARSQTRAVPAKNPAQDRSCTTHNKTDGSQAVRLDKRRTASAPIAHAVVSDGTNQEFPWLSGATYDSCGSGLQEGALKY
jgi:hypothetical protein